MTQIYILNGFNRDSHGGVVYFLTDVQTGGRFAFCSSSDALIAKPEGDSILIEQGISALFRVDGNTFTTAKVNEDNGVFEFGESVTLSGEWK